MRKETGSVCPGRNWNATLHQSVTRLLAMNDTTAPELAHVPTVAERYLCRPKLPNGVRVAHYGRFSTPRQASLEEQERCFREFAASNGGEVMNDHIYTDAGRTGTILANRPGLANLREAAKRSPRPFDYVVITDTSRLSRNIGDIFTIVDDLKSRGVEVYFLEQGLDSADLSFRMVLVGYAIGDENQVIRITQKSREAVHSRVKQGYAGCNWGYGYRGVRVERNTPYAAGYRAAQGTKLEIVESEAPIVRRVMEEFADGQSCWSIQRRLNDEGVPGVKGRRWSVDLVRHILHYELYVGVYVFNATKQKRDRETGRVTKKPRPANEHLRVPLPELRIVEDPLWNQVQARLRRLSEKQNARRQGGYNRAKNAVYLYSGLLFCGECESRMRIGGVQGRSYYECPNHRTRRGCTNHLRLPEKVAATQITAALRDKLLAPETMNWLVASVFREIKKLIDEQGSSGAGRIRELEHEKRTEEKKREKIATTIETHGGDEYLVGRVTALGNRIRSIEKQLAIARSLDDTKLTEDDLRVLVEDNVTNLQGVLKSNPHLACQVLRHHLKKLSLYPGEVDGKPVFEAVGELDIITPAKDQAASSRNDELVGRLRIQGDQEAH